MNYIDVSRTTHTNLDVKQESRIDDYWNIDGSIIVLRHSIDPRRMAQLKGRYAELKKGTSAVLLQSGLDEKRWADSVECCCYLRNVQVLLADGKTLSARRFGEPFKGPVIPFRWLNIFLFLRTTSQGSTKLVRTGRIWKGDVLVADIEELETMDASEIYSKRLNAKEVLTPMNDEKSR